MLSRPAGTSWSSILGGWLASLGTGALVAPLVVAVLSGRAAVPDDLGLAVPVVAAVVVASLIGGYVAGRMAGYSTSWHGMMTAFFGLFVALVALLVAGAADQGWLGLQLPAATYPSGVVDLRSLGDTLSFGAALTFLAAIFAGWLGGLLAPDRYALAMRSPKPERTVEREVIPERIVQEREVRRDRPRFRLLPAVGHKGGERSESAADQMKETRVQRG